MKSVLPALVMRVVLLTLAASNCYAFVPSSSSRQAHQRWQHQRTRTSVSSTTRASSMSSEIFLLSFDGTVAQTTEWRISQGIDLAFSVWPRLQEMDVIADGDDEWLRNKMRAVSPVLLSRPGCSLSVDYALLARLLIEEQQLDHGYSNGCSGKYGSKFHPQSGASSSLSPSGGRGSRPLTVGEIAENWNKGGCLAETVLTKYHIDYESPLTVLQEKIDAWNVLNEEGQRLPDINYSVLDALEYASGNVVITVGHETDLPIAQETIESLGMATTVLSSDEESLTKNLSDRGDSSIMLLPIPTTHGATYRDVLKYSPFGSTVYIFESSWPTLEQGIYLFGDYMPRTGSGMAETMVGRDIFLSLNFPDWATTTAAKTQGSVAQNEAMMNPWTNLVTEEIFSELLSARITVPVMSDYQ